MKTIWCNCGAEDSEGTLWIPSYTYNGLYRCRFDRKEAELVCSFEGEDILREGLYGGAACAGGQVVMVPGLARKLAVYEKGEKKARYYDLPVSGDEPGTAFAHQGRYHGSLYLIPLYSSREIIRYDIEKREVCGTGIDVNSAAGWKHGYRISHSIMAEGHIYMLVKDAGALVDIDVKTGTCICFKTDVLDNAECTGLIDAGRRVLFYADEHVYTWDKRENRCGELHQFQGCKIRSVWSLKGKLYGFDASRPAVYIYDTSSGREHTICDSAKEAEFPCPFGWRHIGVLERREDGLLCFSYHSGEVMKLKDGRITERTELRGEQPKVEGRGIYGDGIVRTEGYHEALGLEGFLNHVRRAGREKGTDEKESIGKKIFEEIVSEHLGGCI